MAIDGNMLASSDLCMFGRRDAWRVDDGLKFVTADWTADRGAEEPIGPACNPIVSDSEPDLTREWLEPIGLRCRIRRWNLQRTPPVIPK